jgi:hypothetical protein
MNIADKFKDQFSPGFYTRIDELHLLDIYIGIDEENHYALEFRGDFTPQNVKASNSIGIKQYKTDKFCGIIFYLKDVDMFDTFCVFCEDIIKSTKNTSDNTTGYKTLINRFYAWKKMFQTKNTLLKEPEIMGLIGELLFLRDFMIPTYGEDIALQSWSGQDLTHKDFSLKDTWYEVKAISTGKPTVRISSLEQLQSVIEGELAVFQLEKMSPAYEGVTLNKIATGILKTLSSQENKDYFISKLFDSNYSFESGYNDYVYEITLGERFHITDSFPKLTRNDVNEAIVKVQYDILLSEIQGYKIDWSYGN